MTLEGTTWVADGYNNGRGAVVSVLGGTEITAQFDAGRMAGSAGCNSYTSGYSVSGNAIEIGPAASTRMACASPEGVMEQETAYLAALPTARVYRIDGTRLFLETAEGARIASFMAVAGALEGTTWVARDYNNGRGAVTSVLAETVLTARFEEGSLSGSAGCNSYTSPYSTDGPAIEIGMPASTDMFCESPAGIMEQEAAYLAALPTAEVYRIQGDQLILERADSTRVASFVAASA
jgi:heat shock protein HslJ